MACVGIHSMQLLVRELFGCATFFAMLPLLHRAVCWFQRERRTIAIQVCLKISHGLGLGDKKQVFALRIKRTITLFTPEECITYVCSS